MSGYFKQMPGSRSEAARLLRERLARKEMGDAAYERETAHADSRGFRLFGLAFIAAMAAVVLVVTALGG